jgi:hypothetical protein
MLARVLGSGAAPPTIGVPGGAALDFSPCTPDCIHALAGFAQLGVAEWSTN